MARFSTPNPAGQSIYNPMQAENTGVDMHWWERSDLRYEGGSLRFAGIDPGEKADQAGTPLYLYSIARIRHNTRRLIGALEMTGTRHRVLYAMKSNRFAPILTAMAMDGMVGVDACSIGELALATSCGFPNRQVSFTATGLAAAEWERILAYPDVTVNCDSIGDIRKVAAIHPGRSIGIRVNPEIGIGYRQNPLLAYSGKGSFSKFGITPDVLPQAVSIARDLGLTVDGLHCHCGCGYLDDQLPAFESIVQTMSRLAKELPGLRYLNLGGGLGIPLSPDDKPLSLGEWAGIIRKHCADAPYEIWIEPGDYLVKDAGLLVLEVTNVEEKCGRRVVWVNGGFNIHPEPVFYKLPVHPVPLATSAPLQLSTIAGNINEVADLWFENIALPDYAPDDRIAFLNAGGYGASMSSNHCMRGLFHEVLIPDRDGVNG